jgi:outer membrane protein OmpA-like peptidoglycan-associated protein
MAAKPMLDGVVLEQVQQIGGDQQEIFNQHAVPALEGDFLQDLGRRATRVRLNGILTGPAAVKSLDTLRGKFRAGTPVTFVSDIATATKVSKMLIEEMGLRELAGKPGRFEYALTLAEFIGVAPKKSAPAPPPPPSSPQVNGGNLRVQIGISQRSGIDFSTATVILESVTSGRTLFRTLSNSCAGVWMEQNLRPGPYITKVVSTDPPLFGCAAVTVQGLSTARVTVNPLPAVIAKTFVVHFASGKSFIDPSMRPVLQEAADYALAHPNQKLLIAGHSDGGPAEGNQLLSEQRAEAVFGYLTYRQTPGAVMAAWNSMRTARGDAKSNSWGQREYELILQDLGYFRGQINGNRHLTSAVVSDFQLDHEIQADGLVGNTTWPALIQAYLERSLVDVPAGRFLEQAWLGFGHQLPAKNTASAWRPNRRVELLFVRPGTSPSSRAKWIAVPVEMGSITVAGSIKLDNGTPVRNLGFSLIAPDGECMDGEIPSGPDRGKPMTNITDASGRFAYPDKPKGIGFYTLEVIGPYEARLAGEPPPAAKGAIVTKRLTNSSDALDVTVSRL